MLEDFRANILNFNSTLYWASALNKCNQKAKICTRRSSIDTRMGEC